MSWQDRQIRLKLQLVRASDHPEAKAILFWQQWCLLLISMYSISGRNRSTKLSSRKRCFVRKSCWIKRDMSLVDQNQHRKKLFNSARATPNLFLLLHGLTLSLKKPKLASRQRSRTWRWVLFREHSRIPHRNSSSECSNDDYLRTLNLIGLRSAKEKLLVVYSRMSNAARHSVHPQLLPEHPFLVQSCSLQAGTDFELTAPCLGSCDGMLLCSSCHPWNLTWNGAGRATLIQSCCFELPPCWHFIRLYFLLSFLVYSQSQ